MQIARNIVFCLIVLYFGKKLVKKKCERRWDGQYSRQKENVFTVCSNKIVSTSFIYNKRMLIAAYETQEVSWKVLKLNSPLKFFFHGKSPGTDFSRTKHGYIKSNNWHFLLDIYQTFTFGGALIPWCFSFQFRNLNLRDFKLLLAEKVSNRITFPLLQNQISQILNQYEFPK